MELVAYDKEKLNMYKRTKQLKFIDEFIESDMDCTKVVNYTNKDAKSCVTSLATAIKYFHKNGIRAIMRDNEVYLVKINPGDL